MKRVGTFDIERGQSEGVRLSNVRAALRLAVSCGIHSRVTLTALAAGAGGEEVTVDPSPPIPSEDAVMAMLALAFTGPHEAVSLRVHEATLRQIMADKEIVLHLATERPKGTVITDGDGGRWEVVDTRRAGQASVRHLCRPAAARNGR